MKNAVTSIGCIGALAWQLAGCGNLIAHAPSPHPAVPAAWQQAPAADSAATGWRSLCDPGLDALIAQALERNRDLVKMAIRLQRAHLQYAGTRQAGLPAFSLSAGANTQHALSSNTTVTSGGVSYQLPSSALNTTGFMVSAGVNYEVDLWSRVAQLNIAEKAEETATAADLGAARLALVTSVAQRYWRIALQDEEIAAALEDSADAQATLASSTLRHQAGAAWKQEVLQAESALLDRQTELDALRQNRLEQQYALAVLLDLPPQDFSLKSAELPHGVLPDIPAGLPSDLLDRRPDVRASRLRMDAALHRLNAAEAARYPQFALTASVNTSGQAVHDILSNPLAGLGLNLLLPFVDWERMRINRDSAAAQQLEAAVDFRDTLYKALAEVETLLAARRQLASATLAAREALALAARQEELALLRYKTGLTARQMWLNEREKHRQTSLQLDRKRVAELDSLVALYKALGILL